MVSLQTELFVEGLGVDCPKQNVGIRRLARSQMPWDLRPTGVPAPEVDVEAQPGAPEAEQGESEGGKTGPERAIPPRPRDEGALPPRGAKERMSQIRGINSRNIIRDRCSECFLYANQERRRGTSSRTSSRRDRSVER